MSVTSRPAEHFARIYAGSADPWDYGGSAYEQAKYDRTIAVLGSRRFAAGLEVGCSIGVLTHRLAMLCDRLTGIDIVEAPLAAARTRCAEQPWVDFRRMAVPADWPEGRFDLIVLSEVLYFLAPADLDRCAARVAATLRPQGTILLVNWLGCADDPSTGDEAAHRFIAALGSRAVVAGQERHAGYRLDLLRAA